MKKNSHEMYLNFYLLVLKVEVAEAKIMHVIQLKHTLELIEPLKVRTGQVKMFEDIWSVMERGNMYIHNIYLCMYLNIFHSLTDGVEGC